MTTTQTMTAAPTEAPQLTLDAARALAKLFPQAEREGAMHSLPGDALRVAMIGTIEVLALSPSDPRFADRRGATSPAWALGDASMLTHDVWEAVRARPCGPEGRIFERYLRAEAPVSVGATEALSHVVRGILRLRQDRARIVAQQQALADAIAALGAVNA